MINNTHTPPAWQLTREKPREFSLCLSARITAPIPKNALAALSLWAAEPDPAAGTFPRCLPGMTFPRSHPFLPSSCFSHPRADQPVHEAGQKQPLSVAWPRCKISQTGIWVCSAQRSQAQLRHPQLGLAENTHRYSFTPGHSPKERFAFLIGSIFWEGKWWIITASAGTWDGMKATQTPRLRCRLRGVSHMLIDLQPWEESVLQKTSLLPPRTPLLALVTSAAFWPWWTVLYFCAATNLICRAISSPWS